MSSKVFVFFGPGLEFMRRLSAEEERRLFLEKARKRLAGEAPWSWEDRATREDIPRLCPFCRSVCTSFIGTTTETQVIDKWMYACASALVHTRPLFTEMRNGPHDIWKLEVFDACHLSADLSCIENVRWKYFGYVYPENPDLVYRPSPPRSIL